MRSRSSSGSRPDASAVEPTRSTNITVSCRRSASDGGAGLVWPAAASNLDRAGSRRWAECLDRLQHHLTRTEGQAEFPQIGFGQLRQDLGRDFGILEGLCVALQPKTTKPFRDVHAKSLARRQATIAASLVEGV